MAADGEWWERVRDRWHAWLSAKPARLKLVLAANIFAVAAVIVANLSVKGFHRGFDVWLACALILLGWLLITPTKTVRWVSV